MKQFETWLKLLGGMRDGVLVLISLLYVLGFLSWATYASIYNLGPVPPLQAFYFVAGLPAMLFLALIALLVKPLRWLAQVGPPWVDRRSNRKRRSIYGLLCVLAVGSALYIYILPLFNWFSAVPRSFLLTLVFMLTLVLTMLAVAVLFFRETGARRVFYVFFGIAFLLVAGLTLIYILIIGYVRVPQQFGGGRFYCAELDLYTEKLSADSLLELAAPNADLTHAVVRSKEIGLLTLSEDKLIVLTENGFSSFRYELGRGDVAAVRFCDH